MSVAETVRPSVRGAEGMAVTALLAISGIVTGGIVGLAVGTLWAALGGAELEPIAVAVVVAAAALGDAAARRWRRARPLSVGRQVPVAWGRLFGPRLAATLYGARLGVGPLTILNTWTWWAALIVGASLGPWPSAAIGATFAVTRTAVMVLVGSGPATGAAMQTRMARVVRSEVTSAWAVVVVVVGMAALAMAA